MSMSMSMSMPEHEHEPMPEYEPLPKKPRLEIQSLTKEELAHLEATEESALKGIILHICSSLELCKQLSDQLYRSVLDGVAVLAYLLFDKEELYELGHSRMLYDQQNKFWEELERFAQKGDSFYEVCKWIANTNINWDGYSLLNECNVAAMLKFYNSNLCKSCPYRKPFVDYIARGLEIEKSPIDDDIEEAIKKAKQYQRLTVDEYTFLLLEIFRDVLSEKCQEFLLAKAVECIDVKALYSLEADAIQDLVELNMHSSAHEELDWLIKSDLMELIRFKKNMVTNRLRTSTMPFSILLHNEFEMKEIVELRYTVPPPLTVFDLISIAELRRKAEGSRFINRDHFLWAFDERGCGLRTALKGLHTPLKDELASRVGAEDHPPYFIYDIVLRLARAEYVIPGVIHLAFAVVFGKFGFSVEEVKELQGYFYHFKTAICDVREPKNLVFSNDWYFGDDSIKVFKERLDANNGIWWYPFTA